VVLLRGLHWSTISRALLLAHAILLEYTRCRYALWWGRNSEEKELNLAVHCVPYSCCLNACSMSTWSGSAQTGNSAIDYSITVLHWHLGKREVVGITALTVIYEYGNSEGRRVSPSNQLLLRSSSPLETRDQVDCEKRFPGNQEPTAICFFFFSLSLFPVFSFIYFSV